LIRLLSGFPGVSEIPAGDELPHFDCQSPLMSLPKIFGTRVETIPAPIPYLKAPAELAAAWREKLDRSEKKLRVGLVWAGHPKHGRDRWRSMKLQNLAPLAAIKGIQFYSLQKGDGVGRVANPPAGMELIDASADLGDFADTAGLVDNLDLVISVDTAAAHLAGGMGKPVWLLLPSVPDWRWMLNRTDSPWYPTMRIFRQSKLGDWEPPIARVVEALTELAARKE
jgi:ADP-heptose:LPS heptosyltransferase